MVMAQSLSHSTSVIITPHAVEIVWGATIAQRVGNDFYDSGAWIHEEHVGHTRAVD